MFLKECEQTPQRVIIKLRVLGMIMNPNQWNYVVSVNLDLVIKILLDAPFAK